MRDNDLLDGAFGAPDEPKPTPKAWKRISCRDLDAVFGIEGEYDDDIFIPPPVVQQAVRVRVATRSRGATVATKRRKKRSKTKRVNPEDAMRLLQIWVKKLMTARKKVQKYRQAVKRYQAQGRI